MRVKFTIAVCALLVLALGASQAYAQAGGYDVLRGIETVVQHGKNQKMGEIQLHYDSTGGIIDAGATITVTFGSLPITVLVNAVCTNGVSCIEAKLNDDKNVITIESNGSPNAEGLAIPWTVSERTFQSGCGRRNYRHHLDLGRFRFDSRRPVETWNRQCSGGRGQGGLGR